MRIIPGGLLIKVSGIATGNGKDEVRKKRNNQFQPPKWLDLSSPIEVLGVAR